MNGPVAKRLGDYTGRVVRWGAGGFGFVRCEALKTEAYFKSSFVVGAEPSVGDEVEFVAMEYPGNKLVAREVRLVGAARREPESARPRPGTPLAGRIRGLEALARVPQTPPSSPALTQSEPRRERPDTLPGVVRGAEEDERRRIKTTRARAAELEGQALAATASAQTTRAEADRRRAELERQLGTLEVDTQRRLEELQKSAAKDRAAAEALRAESGRLEDGIVDTVLRAATQHLTSAREKFRASLTGRDRAVAAVADARQQAARAAGEERVTEYEKARRRARAADDADMRDAFALLEQKRREPVRAYADALDAQDAQTTLEAPFWLLEESDDAESVVVVAPYEPSAPDGDEVIWRVHSALIEATHRLRHEHSSDNQPSAIEHAAAAGCLALRLSGLDADLLPLLLEDALAARPTLARLGIKLRFEEQQGVRLGVDVDSPSVDLLETPKDIRLAAASGGSTREVARRNGMDLDELVAMLVTNGLPFTDDAVSAESEKSLRALLGIETQGEPPTPPASPARIPEAALHPALDVAGRILTKLLRKTVIGGKHTSVDNVYGHHFADSEKDLARTVLEKLVRLGVLHEKPSVGARHVSIEPRKVDVARSLAERRCSDPQVRDALMGS